MERRPLGPGVWGVIATPFRGSSLQLDTASLAREIEHYAGLGATGIVVLGVFGEAASLSQDERVTVLRTAADASGGLPIVVGATSLSTAPAIEEASRAADLTGDALAGVMVQVNSSHPDVLLAHLADIHHATGVGIVVQHYPDAGGASISTQALVEVLNDAPFVVAAKCERAPTVPEVAAVAATTQVPAFGGLGGTGLLDELAAGAAGAMTGFSFPEGLLGCVEADRRAGTDAARAAWIPYLGLANFEFQKGLGLAIRKESLRRRGLIAEAGVRTPAANMPPCLGPILANHLEFALLASRLAGPHEAVPATTRPGVGGGLTA